MRWSFWSKTSHLKRLAAWDPDVLHVHTPGPIGLFGVYAARCLGLPLIHTYHTDLHCYGDAYNLPCWVLRLGVAAYATRLRADGRGRSSRTFSSRRHDLIDAVNHLLLRDSAAVIIPTQSILDRRSFPAPRDVLRIVPTGVAASGVETARADRFRRDFGIDKCAPVVLFVGRLNAEKGIALLTRAFAEVLAVVTTAKLVLIGAVHSKWWLRGLLQEAGITGSTIVTGTLRHSDVNAAYAAADVFAFPSLTDTQGVVLQEAAMAALPIVLVDRTLYREPPLVGRALLTQDNPTAFARGINTLLTSRPAASILGKAAWDQVSQNTPEKFGARVLQIYEQIVDARPQTSGPSSLPYSGLVGQVADWGRREYACSKYE